MRQTITVDLHMHSLYSLDGEYSPSELVSLCRQSKLAMAALTDHNSVRGVDEFLNAAEAAEIAALAGIELDCIYKDVDLHLLGYNIDVSDKRYAHLEETVLEQKRSSSQEYLRIFRNMGIHLDDKQIESVSREGIYTGEMIAEVALADIRNQNHPLLKPYRLGGLRSDNPYVNFFWDYCSQGKEAYLPIDYITFEEALALITDTGGFAVIAHPSHTVGRCKETIAYMVSCGVRGLEVFSSYHTMEDISYYSQIAEELHLLKTAGSDFHGKTKPSVELGYPYLSSTENSR